jgi:hypothetical protein
VHYRAGEWRTSFLPLGFAISRTESADAAGALCKAVLAAMADAGVDLAPRVGKLHLDGGPALLKALRANFPGVEIKRCLQHIMTDLRKIPGKWKKEVSIGRLVWLVEETAFFPLHLFHMTWSQELARIEKEHGAETSLASKHLQKNLLHKKEDGTLDALWRSCAHDAPFSTYTSNIIESFWRKYKLAHGSRPKHRDIVVEVEDLEDCVFMWLDDNEYDDLQHTLVIVGPEASKANTDLKEGKPVSFPTPPSEEPAAKRIPLRKLSARGIIGLAAEGPFVVRETSGTRERWACPKYDPDVFDEAKLRAFMRIVSGDSPPATEDLALFDIHLGFGDTGESVFHAGAVVKMMRDSTLLTFSEGKLTESHKDFFKGGQTEHILWFQHCKTWKDHGHMAEGKAKASPKRRTHAKQKPVAKAKAKEKAKAKPKGRPKKTIAPHQPDAPSPLRDQATDPAADIPQLDGEAGESCDKDDIEGQDCMPGTNW